MKHVPLRTVALKGNASISEAWIQNLIAEEPTILGLGDLVLRDRERRQPRAGRLDLLLQDSDSGRRYEVEIQLGASDETHIIRTLEYWDLERKRYPQYDHCAVIVAEQITGRFLNVISLFNGFIPLIALQLTAYEVEDGLALAFTRVVDEMPLGLVDDDEEQETTDRAYWERRATRLTMKLLDQLVAVVQEIDAGFEAKYNKFYVGLAKGGGANNFVLFKPRKKSVLVEIRLPKSDSITQSIDEAGLDSLDYTRWGQYRFHITPEGWNTHHPFLLSLFRQAHEHAGA